MLPVFLKVGDSILVLWKRLLAMYFGFWCKDLEGCDYCTFGLQSMFRRVARSITTTAKMNITKYPSIHHPPSKQKRISPYLNERKNLPNAYSHLVLVGAEPLFRPLFESSINCNLGYITFNLLL